MRTATARANETACVVKRIFTLARVRAMFTLMCSPREYATLPPVVLTDVQLVRRGRHVARWVSYVQENFYLCRFVRASAYGGGVVANTGTARTSPKGKLCACLWVEGKTNERQTTQNASPRRVYPCEVGVLPLHSLLGQNPSRRAHG